MLIQLEDRTLLGDLCAHFRASAFRVEPHADDTLRVDPAHGRSEILAHLQVWHVRNPQARIRSLAVERDRRSAVRSRAAHA